MLEKGVLMASQTAVSSNAGLLILAGAAVLVVLGLAITAAIMVSRPRKFK